MRAAPDPWLPQARKGPADGLEAPLFAPENHGMDGKIKNEHAARQRDPRIDFFRGLALLIIFVAHVPMNLFAGFIPARFGLSDAADMFVFMSGYAAAIAFGGTFRRSGFGIGVARILYRCWQLYIAQLCLVLFVAAVCVLGTAAFGQPDYVAKLNLTRFFDDTASALVGLLTLTYVPNLLDILPLYIVLLAMVPVAVALASINVWLVPIAAFGLHLLIWQTGFNLPADLSTGRPWFFNPFAWQLIFFTGFCLGAGWIKPPRPHPWLLGLAGFYLLACLVISQKGLSALFGGIDGVRAFAYYWNEKTQLGLARYFHFLALAYVTVTALQGREHWLTTRLAAPIVKCGQQALSVFVLGIVLSWVGGMVYDQAGTALWVQIAVNGGGFALLIGCAYLVGWYKATPWKRRPAPQQGVPLQMPQTSSIGTGAVAK